MRSIQQILSLSTDYLESKKITHPRREAEELLSIALNLERVDLYMQYDKPIQENEIKSIRELLLRRSKGEPCQYLRGKVQFFNCEIEVNNKVLIPRHETEILVDKISKILSKGNLEGKVLWDLCTGSGAIAIALKKKFEKLEVIASDISHEALFLAKKNAKNNSVEVSFLEGDLFSPFKGKKADYIVCNPPYISSYEYLLLEKEVKDFEPKIALLSGEKGTEYYEKIANRLQFFLEKEGKLWMETGIEQGALVKNIFANKGFEKTSFEKDWSNNDRFFFLEMHPLPLYAIGEK